MSTRVGWADVGSQHLRESRRDDRLGGDERSSFGARARSAAGFGWTPPTHTYELQRRINAEATDLDTSIRSYVSDPTFLSSWKRWLDEWRAFFKRSQDLGAKLGAIFWTESLGTTTDGYAADLQGWYLKYSTQKTATGQAVPAPAGSAPAPYGDHRQPEGGGDGGGGGDRKTGFGAIFAAIPWWAYALGVATLGAVGYSFYKAAQNAQSQQDYLMRNVVPQLLPRAPGYPTPLVAAHDLPVEVSPP